MVVTYWNLKAIKNTLDKNIDINRYFDLIRTIYTMFLMLYKPVWGITCWNGITFAFLSYTSTIIHTLWLCSFLFLYLFWLFLSISYFLNILIDSYSTMKVIFNIMSCTNKICTGVVCNLVYHVLHTAKSVAGSISDQGPSYTR